MAHLTDVIKANCNIDWDFEVHEVRILRGSQDQTRNPMLAVNNVERANLGHIKGDRIRGRIERDVFVSGQKDRRGQECIVLDLTVQKIFGQLLGSALIKDPLIARPFFLRIESVDGVKIWKVQVSDFYRGRIELKGTLPNQSSRTRDRRHKRLQCYFGTLAENKHTKSCGEVVNSLGRFARLGNKKGCAISHALNSLRLSCRHKCRRRTHPRTMPCSGGRTYRIRLCISTRTCPCLRERYLADISTSELKGHFAQT